jgi:hypothetical protein
MLIKFTQQVVSHEDSYAEEPPVLQKRAQNQATATFCAIVRPRVREINASAAKTDILGILPKATSRESKQTPQTLVSWSFNFHLPPASLDFIASLDCRRVQIDLELVHSSWICTRRQSRLAK